MEFKKFGKYTLIKKLASGGMADILLASDLSPTGIGRFVVIKRALSKFSENEEFRDMFKNEGKVACNLKHRNITPIYEFGVEKNQFFLCMEYVSGRNLRELTKKLQAYKSSVSIPNAAHIVKEVASGLNYAHHAIDSNTGQPLHLIHRDISPQNIMLSFDGEIKLIDFGIAKIADTNLTRAGHLKGKFSYMSPEQAHGEPLDERTDIFCLGIILWELLTSRRLFASKNELSSLKKIKNCDAPDVQKINPKVPAKLRDIVHKALSKNKNLRYKTAAQMERDLSVFLNKNYPEYSHYEFISLMKTTYRKEIMEERENLKTYSSKFKKYINALNIEEHFKTQIELSLPDIKSLEDLPEKKETKSLALEGDTKNSRQISSYESYFSGQTQDKSQAEKSSRREIEEDQSTLIQKKDFETETGLSETVEELSKTAASLSAPPSGLSLKEQSKAQKTGPIKQGLPLASDGSLAYKFEEDSPLIAPQTDFLKSVSSDNTSLTMKSKSALYDYKSIIYDGLSESRGKRNKNIAFLLPLAAFAGIFFFGALWIIKNEHDMLDMLGLAKNKSAKEEPAFRPALDREKRAAPAKASSLKSPSGPLSPAKRQDAAAARKILIHSKPSGAAIFINNKFSSKHTPSLIQLPSDRISQITIKKEGYLLKNLVFDPRKQQYNSLNLTLKADQQRGISSKKIHITQ